MMKFNVTLKQLRNDAKLTQQKFADIFNVDRTTVVKWESGNNTPPADTLQKIADYFKVSVDFLLGNETTNRRIESNNNIAIIARGGESVEAELSDEQAEMMINFIKSLKEQNKGRNIDK